MYINELAMGKKVKATPTKKWNKLQRYLESIAREYNTRPRLEYLPSIAVKNWRNRLEQIYLENIWVFTSQHNRHSNGMVDGGLLTTILFLVYVRKTKFLTSMCKKMLQFISIQLTIPNQSASVAF